VTYSLRARAGRAHCCCEVESVLDEIVGLRGYWCPPFAGYFLYHPSRRQQSAALSAVIETLRLQVEE
jgi:hypothetical protein